jgi:hypothetical protein
MDKVFTVWTYLSYRTQRIQVKTKDFGCVKGIGRFTVLATFQKIANKQLLGEMKIGV